MSQLTQRVPVGFRFHPTDEELVGYYLPKKVTARKIDLDLIRDLDLYKLEPWDLEDLCKIQADSSEKQTDYYFFSRKDRKYPTGNRANRATTKGFWKATGRDKPIHMTKLQTLIGMRKTLVFYQGRAPHGVKTDWIMHEFRLDDGPGHPAHDDGGWVVCRVFKKNKNLKMKPDERATVSYEEAHQLGQFVPELASSPEILSCGGRFAYPDRSQYGGCVKQEFINLDTYGEPDQSHSMPSTSDEARSYLTRALSLRKCDEDYLLNVPYDGETTSSGATSDAGATTDPEDCSTFLGLPENLDWSLLLQESQKTPASDPVLVHHLKRQNSDIFSSLELWNYAQVAQQL